MTRQQKQIFLKFALILAIVPVAIRAYEFGPDPRYTGAPGDQPSCLAGAGCHIQGSFGLNKGPGSVQIKLAGAASYTPGVKQRIQVVVTDSTKQKFGFQLTARLASNLSNGQAGDFSTVDALTQVLCDDASPKSNGSSCPTAFPVQFIEHTTAGYTASTSGGYTYNVDWTPPATSAGNVTFYVAGNSGPGGAPVSTNANVYTNSLTLSPAAATTGPVITSGGVVPIYSSSSSIQAGSWVTIYGSNLSATTRTWKTDPPQDSEIIGGNFPTSLDGVSATINGKIAFVYFISPGQVNVQAPDDTATGPVSVVVKNATGTSNTATVALASAAPSLFLFDGKYAAGVIPAANGTYGNYDLLGPAGRFAFVTRPVKRGEVLLLYGVGFGATNPTVPAGKVYASAAPTVTPVTITIGGVQADVQFAGITAAGQYQFNVGIPASTPLGDQAVIAKVNGLQTQTGIFVTVQ